MKAISGMGLVIIVIISLSLTGFAYLILSDFGTMKEVKKNDKLSSDFNILSANENEVLIENIGKVGIEKGEVIVYIDDKETNATILDDIEVGGTGTIYISELSYLTKNSELKIKGPKNVKSINIEVNGEVTTTMPSTISTTTTTTILQLPFEPTNLWEEESCMENGRVAINFHWDYTGPVDYFVLSVEGIDFTIQETKRSSGIIYNFQSIKNITWSISAVTSQGTFSKTRSSTAIYCNPVIMSTTTTSTTTTTNLTTTLPTTTTSIPTTSSTTTTLLTTTTLPTTTSTTSTATTSSTSTTLVGLAPRGVSGDAWADVIIGKPDFSEIVPNTVVPNQAYLPHGIIVDRTNTPNKMYVYDAGNNRILGFDLSKCLSATTDPLNCSADIVIGQPSMFTSACNGDSGFQNYPVRALASASSLCGEIESQLSISEGGSGASMDIDSNGNLYVYDAWNNRVLKYIKPFETDTIADDVWGQNDFSLNSCNKGQSSPNATTLCYSWGDSNDWTAGVDVDLAGNLWIVDNGNNRVLRFPAGSKTADLVFGQTGFTSRTFGSGLNQLRDPSAVRVASSGSVYVADHFNQRVLVFKPPFTSGMSGRVFGSGFSGPSGVDLDPTEPGRVWITNQGHMTIELWDEGGRKIRVIGARDNGNVLGDATGSIGIDSVGNIFIAIGAGNYDNDVLMFAKGGSATSPAKRIFGWGGSNGNLKTSQGLGWGAGVAVVDNQVIVADLERLMFWNDPTSLTNGKPADGVAGKGVSTFTDRAYGCCLTLKADKNHHLWVSLNLAGDLPSRIEIYQLPLINGAQPIKTLTFNFPVLGGGTISAPSYQSFWGIAPSDTGDFVWLGHADTSRIIRVRDPLTNPVVDAILGQIDLNGTGCNRGAAPITGATANSLCWPGSLSLDKFGNLYVSDSSLEIRGNYRLLEFNKNLFPTNNVQVIFAPNASKIFPDIATWEPAFDSQNRMVVGYNPYHDTNPQHGWFPGVYNNPLSSSTSPDAFLKDYYSMAFAATFDANDNLYVGDLDRGRVLIYNKPLP